MDYALLGQLKGLLEQVYIKFDVIHIEYIS